MNVDVMRQCVEFVKDGTTKVETPDGYELAVWYQGDWYKSPAALTRTRENIAIALDLDKKLPESLQALSENVECGTAFCVAGLAVHLTEGIKDPKMGYSTWMEKGAQALGITMHEAQVLFEPDNTREMVLNTVRRLCDVYGVADKEVGL